MASYYYLVASLPMLRFDEAPPITMNQFLSSCKQSMNLRDYNLVEKLAQGEVGEVQHEHPFLADWSKFLLQMKLSLHEQRGKALGRVAESDRASFNRDIHSEEVVKLAMQAENPLEAELLLMQYHWTVAEALSQSCVFSIQVLFTYAIQLALLERKALFTPLEGNAEFKRLFSNLQSIIKSI